MAPVQPRLMSLFIAAALAALPAAAHAATVTLGSDLSADASIIEAQGQDTALWPVSVRGSAPVAPEDGQVLSVTIKGTVLSEKGAAPPANMVHFQTLTPEGSGGAMRVYLSSQDFYLPIDQPNAVTTFKPENLCIKQGGVVDFNDIGGFQWGGSLTAPLDPRHYLRGAQFQILGSVPGSVTARYSAADKTNNGDLLDPSVGTDPGAPNGAVTTDRELLMQYVIATGDDRSQSCGGPARHPDGTLVAPKVRQLRVAGQGLQRPYVTKDRRFGVGLYCESPDSDCTGAAVLVHGKKPLVTLKKLAVAAQRSGRISFRLPPALFKKLAKRHSLVVQLVLYSQYGTTTATLNLKR